MAPKKTSDPDVEPRRSGRIASKSVPPAAAPVSKPKAAKKKRPAEEVPTKEDTSSKKQVKSDDHEDDQEGATTAAAVDGDVVEQQQQKEEIDDDDDDEDPSAIDIGDALPRLVLKDEKGEDVQIADLAVEKGVVLFLVPKADTPGCTTQACAFRDIYPDFTSLDYAVYCLSADSPSAQTKWQTKKELPYPLISDPKRILIAALGAANGAKTTRSHFIFEKGGKLVDRKIPVKPADSPKLALQFVQGTVQP